MPNMDRSLTLPPVDKITSIEDVKEYLKKVSRIIDNNQGDVFNDMQSTVTISGAQTITGAKTLGADLNFNGNQAVGLVLETRTDDPVSPVDGQMWYRSDLA